jgi:hypothetical protein
MRLQATGGNGRSANGKADPVMRRKVRAGQPTLKSKSSGMVHLSAPTEIGFARLILEFLCVPALWLLKRAVKKLLL